jgi:hypothetical protein
VTRARAARAGDPAAPRGGRQRAGRLRARHNDSRGISRIVTAPDAARRTVGTPPDLSTDHLRNRHANGDGQPTRRKRGTVLLLHFSHRVADIINFVDYAVDETAHLTRLRAGAGPPSSGQPSPPASTHSGARCLSDLPSRRARIRAVSHGPRPASRLLSIAVSGPTHAPAPGRSGDG